MMIIKKILLGLTVSVYCLFAFASQTHATFSNFVVFGDSLSDIGNFPESHFVKIYDPSILQQGKIPTSNNILNAQNIYVPVTNPITLTHKQYALVVPNLVTQKDSMVKLNYPNLNNTLNYLIGSKAKIDDTISLLHTQPARYERKYRSIGWVEYLFRDLFIDNSYYRLSTSNHLFSANHTQRGKHNNMALLSVDYAWYSALSNHACQDENYGTTDPDCTMANIIKSEKAYRDKQTPETKSSNALKVKIPGLLKQIDFFARDNQTTPFTNKQTKFLIFIGGNDLAHGFNELLQGNYTQGLENLFGLLPASNVQKAITHLTTLGITPKQIYIMSLFNLALTPKDAAYHNKIIRLLGLVASESYDTQLKQLAAQTGTHYIAWDKLIDNLAARASFANHEGLACQNKKLNLKLSTGYPVGTVARFAPGQTPSECGDYLFWNHVHPSSIVEQETGYFVAKQLNRNEQTRLKAMPEKQYQQLLANYQARLRALVNAYKQSSVQK